MIGGVSGMTAKSNLLLTPYESFKLSSRRYTGAKTKLLTQIKEVINTHLPSPKENLSFFDVFAGTGVVSEALMNEPCFRHFYINDFLHSNFAIYQAFFAKESFDWQKLQDLAQSYQNLKPRYIKANYYSRHFAGKFFSFNDSLVIGHIREHLDKLLSVKVLNEKEFYILLASLIYSSDRIANTVGHYDAYRKNVSLKDSFSFKLIQPIITHKNIEIFRADSNVLAKKLALDFKKQAKKLDLVFIDPPYNSRQYSRFYHLLETLSLNNKPILSGVALKPKPSNLSAYCKAQAFEAFKDLITTLSSFSRLLVITYNNTNSANARSNTRMGLEQIKSLLQSKGKTTLYEFPFKAFSSGKTDFKEHKELIFVCEVF